MRSPNNCDSSFRYGVSPQPAQAPENSNSGSRNCTPRTLAKSTRARSFIGSAAKKRAFAPFRLRSAAACRALIALARPRPGLSAGHASCTARSRCNPRSRTASVKRTSGKPRTLIGADLKLVRRAVQLRPRRSILARITPCGQTKLHWPHCTQSSGSHTGTVLGDVALLPDGGAGREGAVHRHARSPGSRRRGLPASSR